jgi:hypothetical protein
VDSLAHGDRLWIPEGLPRSEILERGQARAAALGIPASSYWVWAWTPRPIAPEGSDLRIFQGGPAPPEPDEGSLPIRDPGLRQFAGYRLQFFGPILAAAETARAVSAIPKSSPYQLHLPMVLRPDALRPDAPRWVIDLRDARAQLDQSPIYALMRWKPGTEADWSIHGFDPHPSKQRAKDEWATARRALTLLRNQLRLGGRRHGWRKGQMFGREDFLEWHLSQQLDGLPSSLAELGKTLGVTAETARTRVAEARLPWPPEQHPDAWDLYSDAGDQ